MGGLHLEEGGGGWTGLDLGGGVMLALVLDFFLRGCRK